MTPGGNGPIGPMSNRNVTRPMEKPRGTEPGGESLDSRTDEEAKFEILFARAIKQRE